MEADTSVTPKNLAKATEALSSANLAHAQEFAFIAELDAAGATFHANLFYAEAELCYRKALALREAHGIKDLTYLNTLHRLGVLCRLKQNFADAESFHLQAIALVETMHGPNHPRVADQNNYLAGLYYAGERGEDAARVMLKSLALYESVLGSDSLPVGLCHFALALIYDKINKIDWSQKHFQAAQDIVERQIYSSNETIEEGLLGMAIYHFRHNDIDAAETLFRHSIILREEALWPFHPLVPETLLKLGILYEARGMHAKAELCYDTALTKQQNVFGTEHPILVDALVNLANFHSKYGDSEKAKRFGQQILTLKESE